jgi:Bacteriophage Lambda NinG protein
MSYLPQTKWGDCTQCPAKDVACVKIKKYLVCCECNNRNKAEEQQKKANRRNAARNTGFKLRNGLAESKGTEEYGMAERQALMQDLDYTFSRIVRMTEADAKQGLCKCYTCKRVQHWSVMDCGHFISRKCNQLRFSKLNCRVQCKECNQIKNGNLEIFAEHLNIEQRGLVGQLQEMEREPFKYSRDELKQLLIDFRAKLRIVESKFKTQ